MKHPNQIVTRTLKWTMALLCAALATFNLPAQDKITWAGSHSSITGDSDVVTAGTLVGTYSPYLIFNPGIPSLTVNGVTFESNSLNAVTINMTNSPNMGIPTNSSGPAFSDPNYGALLSANSETAPYDTSGFFVFSNLIQGASYELEIWNQDAYYAYPPGDQYENILGFPGITSGDSPNLNADGVYHYGTNNSGECVGQYVTGTFTASNTVQIIEFTNTDDWAEQEPSGTDIANTYGQGMFNLFQLRLISAPPPQDEITWSSTEEISSDSDVVTNQSTLIGTYSPYLILNPGVSSLTINGVTFQSNSLDAVTVGLTNSTSMGTNDNLTDPNYAALLSGASDGVFNSEAGYLLISNVIPGNEYEVQIWAENVNEPTYDQWENFYTITYNSSQTGNGYYTTSPVNYDVNGSETGDGVGEYVTGTFTPTASNSVVEIQAEPWSEAWGSGTVNNLNGQVQINLLQLRLLEIPPTIATQPPGTNYAPYGGVATISAAAGGSPTLAYQWYETNLTSQTSSILTGQTNSSLVLSNLEASADYYLIVTNSYGSTNSAVASVVVYTSPIITNQLPVTYTNQFTLYVGANPTFSVAAVGLTSLGYQWFTNGVLDAAATTNTLQMTDVQAGAFSSYCIITNSYGSATSVVWAASVMADPANSISGLAPYPQAVLSLNPIGYWRMNDTNLDGPDNGNGDNGYICHDYAGGNDGVYTNVSLDQPGYNPTTDPSDDSAYFGGNPDGANDYGDQDANSIAGINFGAPSGDSVAFTVEAWASGFSQTSDAGIVTLGWGSGGEQFDLDCGSDTAPTSHGFRFLIRDASGTSHAVSSTVEPVYGEWFHLVGVVDEITNHQMTFYINGQSVGTASVASGSGLLSSTNLMGIGSRMGSATTNFNFQFVGNINDVAVFNYALSASQVADEYLVGATNDVAPFFAPAPETSATAVATATLTIPVTVAGTPPIGYVWTNLNTSATVASGVTNAASLNATLNYGDVPASWNGDQLELIVTNAYGSTNAFVTLSIANQIAMNPTNVVFAVTNNQLYLSWPSDHTGWTLQAQTNSLSVGLSTNWVNVNGSAATNQMVIPLNPAQGSVFYRLMAP